MSINLRLPDREAIYFRAEGWTGIREEAVICPSGQGAVPREQAIENRSRVWNYLGREPINSERSANVRFGAQSGLKPDIARGPKSAKTQASILFR